MNLFHIVLFAHVRGGYSGWCLKFDAGMNYIVGHSWVTKLRTSGDVAANYEFLD